MSPHFHLDRQDADCSAQLTADIVVVGSGFGGAVIAARLVEAGRSVLVLERGPWRDTLPVREAGIEHRKPLPCDGGMFGLIRSMHLPFGPKRGIRLNKYAYLDLWVGHGIRIPCTSNVGGGSHIWAGLVEKPRAGFWDHRAAELSDSIMAAHYARVIEELRAVRSPNPCTIPNATDYSWEVADYFTPLRPGEQPRMAILYPEDGDGAENPQKANGIVRTPIDYRTSNGMFGSPGGSKSTVDALYLLPALRKGLTVRDLHEVRLVSRAPGGRYRLAVRDLRNGKRLSVDAAHVVLCAGTMNSNSLMRASVDAGALGTLPALGLGLGANGDLIGTWIDPDKGPSDATAGTPAHGRIKIKGHEDSGYVIISGKDVPPLPGFLRRKAMAKAARTFQIVAMSQDAADGRFWSTAGRQQFAFAMAASPSYARTMQAFEALGAMSGRKVAYDARTVMTAHPMGGCRIGEDPAHSVVDGRGQVHGHSGLYIADASVFPQPVGVPPSLSIAAWASHVAQKIAENPV